MGSGSGSGLGSGLGLRKGLRLGFFRLLPSGGSRGSSARLGARLRFAPGRVARIRPLLAEGVVAEGVGHKQLAWLGLGLGFG